MKKYLSVFILLIIASALILTSCGPKKASQETLAELEELRMAADAAEADASTCATKVEDLQMKIKDLEAEIEELKMEIEKYK